MDWTPVAQANGHAKDSSPFTVTKTAAVTDSIVTSFWNFNRRRMAVAVTDGSIQIWDQPHEGPGPWVCSCKWQAETGRIHKIVWAPPEFGSQVAVCGAKGGVAVWRETREGWEPRWRLGARLSAGSCDVISLAFSTGPSGSLLLAAASSDGLLRVYESLDLVELRDWQLQAEVPFLPRAVELRHHQQLCTDVALSWNPSPDPGQPPALLVGSRGDAPGCSSAQVWELNERFGKWRSVAELAEANEAVPPVNDVAWAPNMGRPYDLLALGSTQGIDIWQLEYSREPSGMLPAKRVAHLTAHQSEVYQVEWDTNGWSLASVGADGRVRVWQCSVGGEWTQQAVLEGPP